MTNADLIRSLNLKQLFPELCPREVEAVFYYSMGFSNAHTAKMMTKINALSVSTVGAYLSSAKEKLECFSVRELRQIFLCRVFVVRFKQSFVI